MGSSKVLAFASVVGLTAQMLFGCAAPTASEDPSAGSGLLPSRESAGAEACASDADCGGGTCVLSTSGEFSTGHCEGGADGAGATTENGSSTDEKKGGSSTGTGGVCTLGQGDRNQPFDYVITTSNSTISTKALAGVYAPAPGADLGLLRIKVIGDGNVVTTDGNGSVVFEIQGNQNEVTFRGGGSNAVTFLSGTDNVFDLGGGGGCNTADFTTGTLIVKNVESAGGGCGVNGAPAQNGTFTLP